jgi:uncharacterized glyoxalase superfamily protein PhnB
MSDSHHLTRDSGGLSGCRPILFARSVASSIDYYVNSLGFHLGWAWSNHEQRFLLPGETIDIGFALVGRGHVQFMLSEQSQGSPGMWLHLDVDSAAQLDALHNEWKQRGAQIDEPPVIRPWGMYEMRLRDPDGHTLRVSSPPPKAA